MYVCKNMYLRLFAPPPKRQYLHNTNLILRRPLRTDADTDADPRGEVFGPRYDSNMVTLVGIYHIYIYLIILTICSRYLTCETVSILYASMFGACLNSKQDVSAYSL